MNSLPHFNISMFSLKEEKFASVSGLCIESSKPYICKHREEIMHLSLEAGLKREVGGGGGNLGGGGGEVKFFFGKCLFQLNFY